MFKSTRFSRNSQSRGDNCKTVLWTGRPRVECGRPACWLPAIHTARKLAKTHTQGRRENAWSLLTTIHTLAQVRHTACAYSISLFTCAAKVFETALTSNYLLPLTRSFTHATRQTVCAPFSGPVVSYHRLTSSASRNLHGGRSRSSLSRFELFLLKLQAIASVV